MLQTRSARQSEAVERFQVVDITVSGWKSGGNGVAMFSPSLCLSLIQITRLGVGPTGSSSSWGSDVRILNFSGSMQLNGCVAQSAQMVVE